MFILLFEKGLGNLTSLLGEAKVSRSSSIWNLIFLHISLNIQVFTDRINFWTRKNTLESSAKVTSLIFPGLFVMKDWTRLVIKCTLDVHLDPDWTIHCHQTLCGHKQAGRHTGFSQVVLDDLGLQVLWEHSRVDHVEHSRKPLNNRWSIGKAFFYTPYIC